MQNKAITIAGYTIEPGKMTHILLPSATLYTQTKIDIPTYIFHGKKMGPKVFVIGTIHGDELNSIEIIRRLHKHKALFRLHGTLITIPIANVFGFILQSRLLPDRRDLNRSFPGTKEGSLSARLANVLIEEIVMHCNYGIDLHTGAFSRINMPQLRVNLETPGAEDLARAFGVPVIIDAKLRDGSLRQAASELGMPLLVYEGGEALRYNEIAIRMGLRGILNVLISLGMLPSHRTKSTKIFEPVIAQSTSWVRAPTSGLVQPVGETSKPVKKDQLLAYIHDPFLLNKSTTVVAPFDGIIIGQTNRPLANEGDALYNLASIEKLALADVSAQIEELNDEISD